MNNYDDAGVLILPQAQVGAPLSIPERDELEMLRKENLKLKSEIDRANAQEPTVFVKFDSNDEFVSLHYNKKGFLFDQSCSYVGFYARPIPAQKSVDRNTIINVLLSIGNMSEGIIADAIISAIGAQQSPAVAVPDDLVKLMRAASWELKGGSTVCHDSGSRARGDSLFAMATKINDYLASMATHQSPRITEQDAREIIAHYIYDARHVVLDDSFFTQWLDSSGRALLEKLNKPENRQNGLRDKCKGLSEPQITRLGPSEVTMNKPDGVGG